MSDAETNAALYANLCKAIQAQLTEAETHIAASHYWQNTGYLERDAANDVLRCVEGVSRDLPAGDYERAVREALLAVAWNWRNDDSDEAGYGVGTVHAIGKLVPGYTDESASVCGWRGIE